VVRVVKTNSSKSINERKFVKGIFRWQEGFGAFSYSVSQRHDVINYIMNQEEHHGKTTFQQEYTIMLREFEIEATPRFLFEFYD
jgi:putative transposase